MCTADANMAPAGHVDQRCFRLCIYQPCVVPQDSPLPFGLNKIQWQTKGHFYWMEIPQPTMPNLCVWIERVLARGYGYRLLVGATIHGTRMLLDDPKKPVPVAEIHLNR